MCNRVEHVACRTCAGEAGWEEADQSFSRWSLDPPGAHWVNCSDCHGSGLEEGINQLDFYDLEERCGPLFSDAATAEAL